MFPKRLKDKGQGEQEKESKAFQLFLAFSLLLMCVLGLGIAFAALTDEFSPLYQSISSFGWSKTGGKVIKTSFSHETISRRAKIPTVEGGTTISRDGIGCFPNVVYSFKVAGREYRGNKIDFSADKVFFDLDDECEAFLDDYRNKDVEVFYNPANPNESTLSRDYVYRSDDYIAGCCCGSFGLFFVLLFWLSIRDLMGYSSTRKKRRGKKQ